MSKEKKNERDYSKYEYKTETVGPMSIFKGGLFTFTLSGKIENVINNMAKKGWELVNQSSGGLANNTTLTFRREKKDKKRNKKKGKETEAKRKPIKNIIVRRESNKS